MSKRELFLLIALVVSVTLQISASVSRSGGVRPWLFNVVNGAGWEYNKVAK